MGWPSLQGIFTIAASVILSTLSSLIFGPFLATRQEAARRDLVARRDVARSLLELLSMLERELSNRRILKSGGSVPANQFINRQSVEQLLWRVVQRLQDPDLNHRLARTLARRLAGFGGRDVIELLWTCPSEHDLSSAWETHRQAFATYFLRQHGSLTYPLDVCFLGDKDPHELEQSLAQFRELCFWWLKCARSPIGWSTTPSHVHELSQHDTGGTRHA